MRGLDFHKKVCLIEKDKIGGAGIFNGALSSKTMWELSQKVGYINETIATDTKIPYEIPWSTVQHTIEQATFERKFQYSCHVNLLQKESTSTNFEYIRGKAKFLTDHELEIDHDGKIFTIW